MSDSNDHEEMFGSGEEDEEELSAPCQFCQEHAHDDPGEGKEICFSLRQALVIVSGFRKAVPLTLPESLSPSAISWLRHAATPSL